MSKKIQNVGPSTRKYSYFDGEKENRNVQTDLKERDKERCLSKRSENDRYCSQSKNLRKRAFSPLFPENRLRKAQNSENTTPNKSPYLQMPSFPNMDAEVRQYQERGGIKNSTVKNIGDMIDSLNTKINSYIENHHLEDTFRKFKLDFVHLRQNMYS